MTRGGAVRARRGAGLSDPLLSWAVDGFLRSVEHDLFVRTRGPRGAPAVVYVHGLGESGLCFERLAQHPALAHLRHVVPDLPGYGRSPWPPLATSLAELADHLAGWLALRGEPAPVIVR